MMCMEWMQQKVLIKAGCAIAYINSVTKNMYIYWMHRKRDFGTVSLWISWAEMAQD